MTFRPEPIQAETWPAIFALLAPAIQHGADATVTELIDDLLANQAQLWVKRTKGGDPIAAAVTELVRTPLGHLVHGRLLGGKGMLGWIDEALDCVAGHARYIGAIGITITGRKGWARVLGRRGWRERAIVMECSL